MRYLSLIVCLNLFIGGAVRADEAKQQQEAAAVFAELYGPQIRKALASRSRDDDLSLAKMILSIAKGLEDQPALLVIMCRQVFDMTVRFPQGYEVAEQAMQLLIANAPDQRDQLNAKLIDLRQRQYAASSGDQKVKAGQALIKAIEPEADRLNKSGKDIQAAALYRRAMSIAWPTYSMITVRASAVTWGRWSGRS